MKINILGQDYNLVLRGEDEFPKLKELKASGLAELYSKELVINRDHLIPTDETYDNLEGYINKVIRHEVVHAYFHEAGLTDYCMDELLVDWLALQLPKIITTIKRVEEKKPWQIIE